MAEIVILALRAVIDLFEIYIINSLIQNKNLENNFIMSKALFGVAQPKQNINYCFNEMPLLNTNLYSKFSLLRWFFDGITTSFYSLTLNFQIDYIVKNKQNHRKSENSEYRFMFKRGYFIENMIQVTENFF